MTSASDALCEIPATPEMRGYESTASAEIRPRYEDVTQDGRVQLTAIMPGMSAIWRKLYSADKLEAFTKEGILPILHRLIFRAPSLSALAEAESDGPFSVHVPIEVSGTWRLAREKDGERIFLNMWLEAHAPNAHTLGSYPSRDAERKLIARVFAEHVITKPFAPRAERKVTRLDGPGLPPIPEDLHVYEDASSLIADHVLEPSGDHVFGRMHTDSNQHVNSLVYPRVFEEAVARRLMLDGAAPNADTLLSRAVEMRYRKPFFSGNRAAISLDIKSFEAEKATRAIGAFTPFGNDAAKPSCTIAMWLR